MGGAFCLHDQDEADVIVDDSAMVLIEGADDPWQQSVYSGGRGKAPSESSRSHRSNGSHLRVALPGASHAPRKTRDEVPSGQPRIPSDGGDSRSRSGRSNHQGKSSGGKEGQDDEEDWHEQEDTKLEFLRHAKMHAQNSAKNRRDYEASEASWAARSEAALEPRSPARSEGRYSDRSRRSEPWSEGSRERSRAAAQPERRLSRQISQGTAESEGKGIAELLESFAMLPHRLSPDPPQPQALLTAGTPTKQRSIDGRSDGGRSAASATPASPRVDDRLARSSRSDGGFSNGGRGDGGRSRSVDNGGGVLATLGSESMFVDLESKLLVAQQKVDDLNQRCRQEEERAKKAEAKLEQVRKETPGGSDMEFQLMQNLVELRKKVDEYNAQAKDEDGKVNEIARDLAMERRQREEAEQEVSNLEQLRLSLQDRLETLKTKTSGLEKEVEDKSQQNDVLQRGLEVTSRERDELLVLAKRALAHKEKEQKEKVRTLTEVEDEKKRLIQGQRKEQENILQVLSAMDQLVARLGRGDVRQTSDALRELSSIRQEMRQLIKQRRPLPGIKE